MSVPRWRVHDVCAWRDNYDDVALHINPLTFCCIFHRIASVFPHLLLLAVLRSAVNKQILARPPAHCGSWLLYLSREYFIESALSFLVEYHRIAWICYLLWGISAFDNVLYVLFSSKLKRPTNVRFEPNKKLQVQLEGTTRQSGCICWRGMVFPHFLWITTSRLLRRALYFSFGFCFVLSCSPCRSSFRRARQRCNNPTHCLFLFDFSLVCCSRFCLWFSVLPCFFFCFLPLFIYVRIHVHSAFSCVWH